MGQCDYRGRFGKMVRSWRAPIAFATFRAWPCGVSLLSMSDIGWPGLRRSMAPAGRLKRKAGTKLSLSGRAATSILILRLTQSKSHEIVREFPAS